MSALTAAAAVVLSLSLAGPPEVGVDQLLSDPASFDAGAVGEIVVTGELVGDFQKRGRWVWAQLNDDGYVRQPLRESGVLAGANSGVGVRFATSEFEAAGLEQAGGYRFRGPVVRLAGEWRHHDEARGGESYFAVTAFEILERERLLHDPMPWGVLILGFVLVALGAGVRLVRKPRGN